MRLPSCLILLIAILSRLLLAAEPKASESRAAEPATGSIAGDIVPPEGAEVTLQGYQLLIYPVPDSEQPAAPQIQFQTIATVDEMGHFLFDGLPPGRYVIQPATTQNVPFFVTASAQLQLKDAERLEGIKLHLTVGRQLRGRVVDDLTGNGIESVDVSVYSTFQIDAVQKTSAKTDAEGRYSAWFVPGDVRVRVTQVPVEYLLPSAETDRGPREFSGGEWPQIELARAAKLKVKVVDEQGKPVPRALLDIQRAAVSRPTPRSPALEQTDAWGEFTVEQLTPSEPVGLRARSATAVSESLIVVPSEIAGPVEVVVSEKLACWLSGQIVDRQGRPVPGTTISLTGMHTVEQENGAVVNGIGRGLQTLRTAANQPVAVLADGSFETEALWPGDHYHLQVSAPGHGDLRTPMVLGEPGKRHDFGPLTLDAFATFVGQVVDVAGRPAAKAELRVVLPAGSPQSRGDPLGLVCDEEGRFELPEMNLAGTLRIWARGGRATTNGPASFFPDLIEGPLKIVVNEAHAFRVAGEIVDRHGRPVRAASVVAVWPLERRDNPPIRRLRRGRAGWPPRSEAIEQVRLAGTTLSDDGSFVTAGLWPDQRYQLRITAEGYLPVESRTFSGRGGETANAGRFELRRTGLTLAGEVVDAARQPVAGATVFNSGDAAQPLTATTDAAGRFRLEGLSEGPVYLLVRKPGFWPAGVHSSTSDVGAQVRLIDESRPRPESRLPAASQSSGAGDLAGDIGDIAVARRLLSELWELRHRIVDSNNASRTNAAGLNRGLIFRMAAIDRDEALRWSAAEGGASDDMLRQREINRLVNDGVEGAMERAGADGSDSSLTSMAAGRLDKGDRDGAIRLLEMALQANLRMDATGNNAPRHIRSQAEIGALAIAAGHEAWGIRWVNEAADRVEALAADADSHTRAAVAAALALFDLQRAVQLWEMPHPRRNNIDDEYAVALARALAPRDLRAARRVAPAGPLKRLVSGFVVESNTFIPLARRLARSQPETALELLDEIEKVDRLEKAETLGRIAVGMALRDKSRAFELIDQALALCFAESRSDQNAIVEVRRAECGARIALMAEKGGYPDMKFVVAQVLALRLTPDEQPSAELRSESLMNASRPLALLDRSAARTMLSEAARPPAPTARNARESKLGNWLEAWALVDAAQAEKLFHEVLADEGPRISAECVESGLLPMIRLLSTPPEDREQTLFPTTSYWVSPPGGDE